MSTSHEIEFPATGHPIRVTISEDSYVPRESDPDGWEHRTYRVWITYQGRTMSCTYTAGMAHAAGAVDPRDVLYSIASDGDAGSMSFPDFVDEYGYEYEAQTLSIHRACEAQFDRIRRVFKSDARKFYPFAAELGQ